MKTRIKLTLGDEHRINFGTAAEPEYKTDGDEVACDKKVADKLVAAGLSIYVEKLKEESQDGK
ncbi:hypothetical protein [Paenibacillus xanthanilyticus]|uniref:Phage protein n=1 Tax=Paenibacillus xanthanilyticus TaxID=1783531 RepID=A0ABV8KC34_9BACL